MTYVGPSIVDFLNEQGQKSDFASRAVLAASKGITGYTGSASQNTQLLNALRGGQTTQQSQQPAPTTQPSQPTSTPSNPAQQAQTGGVTPEGIQISQLPSDLVWNGQLDVSNPVKKAKYDQLVQQYKGNQTTGTPGAMNLSTSFLNTPTINLPDIYQKLFDTSGISTTEMELSDKSKAYAEAVSKIKDNPYLSEATMSGRLRKLEDKFNADTTNLRNDIATKKADIETKLNIEMKQFDINSTQAQQALTQFQTLLNAGALNNASGEDIANITRSTGLSSSMIQSAIDALKKKNVQTSTIQYDDGTNQGFAIINSETGEIISKQVIAQSKPKEATATKTKETEARQTEQNAIADIKAGSTLKDIINHYAVSGGLSVDDLYRLYNSNSPYGKAKESIDEVKEGKFKA